MSASKQMNLPLKPKAPRWYFIVRGQLVSIRADNRVQAFRRARILVGLA
jgi:hypothetical protein